MINGQKVLGLIPARGGSKGVTRKNVRLLGDKPLVSVAILEAKKSQYIDRLVVSTDDQEVAGIAKEWGADIPFIRPDELATDTARGIDVVLHALDELPDFSIIVLLQPTSPFRTVADIDSAIQLCVEKRESVVSVVESSASPYWMYTRRQDGIIKGLLPQPDMAANRQSLPKVYLLNGAVYVGSRESLRRDGGFLTPRTLSIIMPSDRSLDIDDEIDWKIAELTLLERQASFQSRL